MLAGLRNWSLGYCGVAMRPPVFLFGYRLPFQMIFASVAAPGCIGSPCWPSLTIEVEAIRADREIDCTKERRAWEFFRRSKQRRPRSIAGVGKARGE
jgi:hypothetical protein